MHGRPRQPKGVPVDPEKAAAKEKKVQQFKLLTNTVLNHIKAGRDDEEALGQSALLLRKNPDVYTVWNYRRRVVSPLLDGAEGPEAAKAAALKELQVTEAALIENPKSYTAWHHRLWVMRKGLTPASAELKLIGRFLELDSRNFHAWRYRRYIAQLAGAPLEEELAYSRSLIDANFSNHSAWHARGCLLAELHQSRQVIDFNDLLQPSGSEEQRSPAAVPGEVLEEEYDLVQQAVFTDPEDQSAYMYHRRLLEMTKARWQAAQGTESEQEVKQETEAVLQREAERCKELLELEPDRKRCKWPLLTLAHILGVQNSTGLGEADTMTQRSEIFAELAEIDPLRKGFYADAANTSL